MKLLCVDSNSILNRAFYGIKLLTTKDGTYTNAVYGFMNILQKLLGEVQPDCVMCAFDLKAPTFRHKMFTDYKAQRKGMPEELAQQLPVIKELLDLLGYRIVSKEGFEADDILGTFSALCEKAGHDCFIATGDRDSLQLIGNHTTVLLASSKMGKTETIICDEDYFKQKYGTTPKHLVDIKALMGDSSDNIPGVAGIGEKTALKLVGQYGSIDEIYSQLDSLDVTKSVKDKLEKGKESAFLSRTLATIDRNVPLDCGICDCKTNPAQEQEAFALLTRLEMFQTIKKLGLTGQVPQQESIKSAPLPKMTLKTKGLDLFLSNMPDSQSICFLVQFDEMTKDEISTLAVYGEDCVYLADATGELEGSGQSKASLENLVRKLLETDRPKVTYDCKSIYRWSFRKNCSLVALSEDVMLSAYLLSANSTDYTVANLRNQYSLALPPLELPEDFPPTQRQIVENCAVLPRLAAVLAVEIKENEQQELLSEIELPLAKVLASMEHLGFAIDEAQLRDYGNMLDTKLTQVQSDIYEIAGETFNINSPKQMGEILFERLGLPVGKKTKTGYSTNVDVLEGLLGKHEIISNILEYRKLSKLKSTYVDGLLKVIAPDGRIHSHFNQTDTRTGRLSSTEPNLQNIPVRTELGSRLREFFLAKDCYRLVDADYSQIELRVLAHIAKDEQMIGAFQSGEDIHTNTAAQVFSIPPLFVTPEMRRRAKAVNFGIVYGIGAFSLAQDINVSVAEADKYIKRYLETYSGVRQYMEDTIAFAKKQGYVSTLFGRRRYLPELSSSNKNMINFGQRVAMNTPIQGTAADIIKIAMIRVFNRLEKENLDAKLILQVHDELIVEAREDIVPQVKRIVQEEMEQAMSLHVKLTADVHDGKTWFEAK